MPPTEHSATVRCVDGVFILELGPSAAHLYESQLDVMAILQSLAVSVAPARLIVDLSHVELMGSSAIGRLVTASRTLSLRGGELLLANTNSYCRIAIAQSGLTSILPSFDSTASATDHLHGASMNRGQVPRMRSTLRVESVLGT